MIKIFICTPCLTDLFKSLKVDDYNKVIIADLSKEEREIIKKIIKKITGKSKFQWLISEYYTMKDLIGEWMAERFGEKLSVTILFKNPGNYMFVNNFVDTAFASITNAAYDAEGDPAEINKAIRNIRFNIIIEGKNGRDM